ARALAGAGVGVRALAAHRQAAAMPRTAVAAEVHEALDAELDIAAQVALDAEVRLDRVADPADVILVEVIAPLVGRDAGLFEHGVRPVAAEPVDVRECDLDALVAREVDACDACHVLVVLVGWLGTQPWRCLWRGLLQMTRT